MDANGTHFHLLLGYDDWGNCTDCTHEHYTYEPPLHEVWEKAASSEHASNDTGLAWDDTRKELTLQPLPFQFPSASKDNPPKLSDRRGAGRDRFGNWYWIDETRREIRVNSVGTGKTSHFWSVGDGLECLPSTSASTNLGAFQPKEPPVPLPLLQLSGLAVTEDHYLVVGVLNPPGLLIFDLHAGGSPRQLYWPQQIKFAPFDMAAKPKGGVWILDRENLRYWALDRQFNIIREDQGTTAEQQDIFQPKDGGPVRCTTTRTAPEGFSLSAGSSPQITNPIAIEALPDDTVLILDSNPDEKGPNKTFSRIYRYRFGTQAGSPIDTKKDFTVSLVGYDFAFVPEHPDPNTNVKIADQLYIAAADGNQSFAFFVSQENDQLLMKLIPDYFPMRLFGGKGIVTAGSDVYYDFADGWIPLVRQPRRRYVSEAVLCTPLGKPDPAFDKHHRHAFDGREPDCVWHRFLLDACIPPGTEVLVESRAANDENELALTTWQQEPHLYLRGDGPELPYMRKPTSADGNGTWELLFQSAQGRYLQLKLTLRGNGRSTPRLRALRAYYPRFSYLTHYLPAVYREDSQSASFLDRFLANIEGFFTTIEDKIAAVQLLFDTRSAPQEVLDWLASWFGIALDPTWDEAKRRLFIKHAMDFFQYRGTVRGLLMALRLTLEDCADERVFTDVPVKPSRPSRIRVVEKYRTRSTPGVVLGDPTDTGGLRLIPQTTRWVPSQGRANLHQRYTDFLRQQGLKPSQVVEFTLSSPQLPTTADTWQQFVQNVLGITPAPTLDQRQQWQDFFTAAWQQFAQNVLGFVPSITKADPNLWQDFLARRYRRISAYNTTYQTNWDAFESIPLPGQLPADGAALLDWYQFETIVLPMQSAAHRFTVLLSVPPQQEVDTDVYQRRLALTKRIVELEKPAHTVFDVKFFWALFRLGEARLGEDTLIDLGSRAPQLLPAMILAQGHLAESYLAPGHPQNVPDRQVLGRDRLNR